MTETDWTQFLDFGMAGLFILYLIYQSEIKDKRMIIILQQLEAKLGQLAAQELEERRVHEAILEGLHKRKRS